MVEGEGGGASRRAAAEFAAEAAAAATGLRVGTPVVAGAGGNAAAATGLARLDPVIVSATKPTIADRTGHTGLLVVVAAGSRAAPLSWSCRAASCPLSASRSRSSTRLAAPCSA